MKKLQHTLVITLLLGFFALIQAQHSMQEPMAFTNKNPGMDTKPDMVKVYVKQDQATYQKQSIGNTAIDFSVQLSASSGPVSEKTARKEWEELGPVYVQKENGLNKLRIGPYETQMEAKQVLLQVKSKGRKDAFIVVRQGIKDNDTPKNASNKTQSTPPVPEIKNQPKEDLLEGDYKVRVVSYQHPGTFNPEGIEQLGRLESYRKGEWTIMMLGGFRTKESAKKAKEIVLSKGYTDAAVVIDKDGILETIE